MDDSRFMLQRWLTDGGYWETLHDLPTLFDVESYLDSWNTPHEYRVIEYTEIRRTRKEGTAPPAFKRGDRARYIGTSLHGVLLHRFRGETCLIERVIDIAGSVKYEVMFNGPDGPEEFVLNQSDLEES